MNAEQAIKWMSLFNNKIQVNKDYLSQLDTPIGDGDHGGNMARGMAAVMENLEDKDFANPAEVFKVVSMQLLSKVGGASGPLYGSAFMGFTKSLQTSDSVAEAVAAGLEMIQKRGKAEVGEKTMVDIWVKVLEDLRTEQLSLDKIHQYIEDSAPIRATKGRASYLGERSIGHIDPGTCSSGYLFEALVEAGD
ncbi:dihydroxyacetone kinase subunit DhaL [Streptococcus dentasini]